MENDQHTVEPTQVCTKCGAAKTFDKFAKHKGRSIGMRIRLTKSDIENLTRIRSVNVATPVYYILTENEFEQIKNGTAELAAQAELIEQLKKENSALKSRPIVQEYLNQVREPLMQKILYLETENEKLEDDLLTGLKEINKSREADAEQRERAAWDAARETQMYNGLDPNGERAYEEKNLPSAMRTTGFAYATRIKYANFDEWQSRQQLEAGK